MSKLDKDSVLEKFTKAYEKANGKAPDIDAAGGWYAVDGGKKMRLAQLDELADSLASGDAKAEDKPAAASTESKTEESAAKKPAKKADKKTKKASKPVKTFSVKDFYANEILAKKPGSRSPR